MVNKIYRKLIVVQVCIYLVLVIGSIIDTAFIGNFYGVDALASIGIVVPIETIIYVIAGIFSLGVQVVCSISIGKFEIKKASSQVTTGIMFSVFVFLVGVIFVYAFIDNILICAGAEYGTEVFANAKDYMYGVLPMYFTGCLNACLMYLLQINGKQKLCILSMGIFVVSNTCFDLLNIFLIKMGLFGMGLATSLSYFISIAFLLIVYFAINSTVKINLRLFNIKYIKSIFSCGIVSALVGLYDSVIILIINNIMIQSEGSAAVAGITAIFSLSGLLWSVSSGISYCTSMVSGLMYGERNINELKSIVRTFVKLSILLNAIVAVVLVIFADFFVAFYISSDEPIFLTTVLALRVFAFSIIPYSIGSSFKNWFNSTNKRILSIVYTTLADFVFILIFVLLLIDKFSIVGVFASYIIAPVITLILLFIYCCIKNKSWPFSASTYLLLPKDYAIKEEYLLERNIQTKIELQHFLFDLEKFCKTINTNDEKFKYISLVVEELGYNILEYGMVSPDRKYNFNVRIFYDNQSWTVRLRDDCEKFNPNEYLLLGEEEKAKNEIGLKLVFKIAKNVEFNYIVCFNNILLTI